MKIYETNLNALLWSYYNYMDNIDSITC